MLGIKVGSNKAPLIYTGPDGIQRARGYVKRDYTAYPSGYLGRVAEPFNLPLLSPAEIKDGLKDQQANQSSLYYERLRMGPNGGRIPSLDQNGQGFCWAYSTTGATMMTRMRAGLPYKRLSGHMVGCLVKNYQDQGGWNTESLAVATSKGIASVETWKEKSMSRSNETPEMFADAATNLITEWWDGIQVDKATLKQILGTMSVLNIPMMVDFPWWGHSVLFMGLKSWDPLIGLILNSWADGWGDFGIGEIEEAKMLDVDAWGCQRQAMAA